MESLKTGARFTITLLVLLTAACRRSGGGGTGEPIGSDAATFSASDSSIVLSDRGTNFVPDSRITLPDVAMPADRVVPRDVNTTGATLRFAAGTDGAIEIFHDGEWRAICDDGFAEADARVACRQLGFSGARGLSRTVTFGSGSFWLDEVACSGTEARLDDCAHAAWGTHDCSAGEAVAVTCE